MKTLILYDSKTGCTKKCAMYINRNNDAVLSHIKNFNMNLNDFNKVILLTPVYMGHIKKSIKTFLDINQKVLLQKDVTICFCAMNVKEYSDMLKNNLDESILNHANIIHAGGAYYFDKLNFIYRFIVKKMTGISNTTEEINYDKLDSIST